MSCVMGRCQIWHPHAIIIWYFGSMPPVADLTCPPYHDQVLLFNGAGRHSMLRVIPKPPMPLVQIGLYQFFLSGYVTHHNLLWHVSQVSGITFKSLGRDIHTHNVKLPILLCHRAPSGPGITMYIVNWDTCYNVSHTCTRPFACS